MHRILVVEDEESIQLLLKFELERRGYEVVTAGTAAEAVKALSEKTPDLVILDYLLPDKDGVDLMRFLSENPRFQSTRIIICTAALPEEDRWWRQMGDRLPPMARAMIKEFVGKPFDMDHMEGAVRRVLGLPPSDRSVRPLARALAPEAPPDRFIAIPDLPGKPRILVVEDEEVSGRMITEYLQRAGYAAGWCINGMTVWEILNGAKNSKAGADVLILDLALPDTSGEEVLGKMAQQPALQKVRVIIITGRLGPGEEEHFLKQMQPASRALVSSILLKPYQMPDFMKAVKKAVSEIRA